MPNENDFLKDERPREFLVTFDVRGEITLTIQADSEQAAKAKAEEAMDDDDFGLELDEVSDVRILYLRKAKPMFLVIRNGEKIKSSWLEDGDIPRQPDERGF